MMDNQIKQELATRSSGFLEQRLSVARLAKADASAPVTEWHRTPADCVASFDYSDWSEWFNSQHGGIDGFDQPAIRQLDPVGKDIEARKKTNRGKKHPLEPSAKAPL